MIPALAVAALLLLASPRPAWACFAPPEHQTVHYSELVRRTPSIILADATNITKRRDRVYRYRFRSVEVLKGKRVARFTVDVLHHDGLFGRRVQNTDFDGHRDSRFWDRAITGHENEPDCEMRPRFEPGSRYLVFRTPPYHWRSFERIDRSDDRWLAAVRVAVRSGGRTRGFSQDIVGWLREHDAVDVDEIESCSSSPPTIKRLEHLAGTARERPRFWPDFGRRPFEPCQPGTRFLAAHYEDEESESLPLLYPSAFPITGGNVDFSGIDTEIEIVGPPQVPLDELRRRLR